MTLRETLRAQSIINPGTYPASAGSVSDGKCHILFDDLGEAASSWLLRRPAVVGCVAWLSDVRIMESLDTRQIACITMQKEQWLRPDYAGRHPSASLARRAAYRRLNRVAINDVLPIKVGLDGPGFEYLPRYRVFGYADAKPGSRPTMHHKFFVGCDIVQDEGSILKPMEVMTGSHNFSSKSDGNLDNLVIIESEAIARAYFNEWAWITGNSQSLDYDTGNIEPEWMVGE